MLVDAFLADFVGASGDGVGDVGSGRLGGKEKVLPQAEACNGTNAPSKVYRFNYNVGDDDDFIIK